MQFWKFSKWCCEIGVLEQVVGTQKEKGIKCTKELCAQNRHVPNSWVDELSISFIYDIFCVLLKSTCPLLWANNFTVKLWWCWFLTNLPKCNKERFQLLGGNFSRVKNVSEEFAKDCLGLWTVHSWSFCKNLAHFSGNFGALKRVKKVKNGSKMAQKGQKGIRKVQKYHKNDKIGPKFVQWNRRKNA